MEIKEGTTIFIKSKEWYDKLKKDKDGDAYFDDNSYFTKEDSKYCNCLAEILENGERYATVIVNNKTMQISNHAFCLATKHIIARKKLSKISPQIL